MTRSDDDRSAMARAMAWVSRITTVSFEMVVPGLIGIWLDGRFGTKIVFTLLGFAAGLSFAMWHLIRMAAKASAQSSKSASASEAGGPTRENGGDSQ